MLGGVSLARNVGVARTGLGGQSRGRWHPRGHGQGGVASSEVWSALGAEPPGDVAT